MPNSDGVTALIQSIGNNHMDIAKLLIEKGADINAARNDGSTPLIQSIVNKHMEIAKLLIEKGADINAEYKNNGHGYTALEFALKSGHMYIVNLLKKKRNQSIITLNPLSLRAGGGREEVLNPLLRAGGGREEVLNPLSLRLGGGREEVRNPLYKATGKAGNNRKTRNRKTRRRKTRR
jgi:ankyrin repeat protein